MSNREDDSAPDARAQVLERLRALRDALKANPSDWEAWSDWLGGLRADAPHIYGDGEAGAVLAQIAAIPGYSGKVKEVKLSIRDLAGEAKQREQRRRQDAPPPRESLTEILVELGYTDAPAGLEVPGGYRVTGGRIETTSELAIEPVIAERIVVIVGRATNAESRGASVTLAWAYNGSWHTETVDRQVVSDARRLLELSGRGCPVDSTTGAAIVTWLRKQEAAAASLPSTMSLSRCGWTPKGDGFLLGTQSLGAPVHLVAPGDGERGRAEGYHRKGSLDAWIRDVWTPCRDQPAGVVILSALCAPLLQVLDAPGWTLDVGGEKGTGKSAALKAALSACGDPNKLWHLWGPNWPGVRMALEFAHSVPCLLDDTMHLNGDWKTALRAVFLAHDRTSQALGNQSGGTRAAREVRTVLLSTGESRIANHCAGANGAASRMLTLEGRPWEDPEVAPRIYEATREHYGHVLPLMVQWLLNHRERWPALKEQWRAAKEKGINGSKSTDVMRVAQYPAMIEVAAHVARLSVGLDIPKSLIDLAWSLASTAEPERDQPARAWEFVQSYGAARPDQWAGAEKQRTPLLGVSSAKDAARCWTTQALTDALEAGGFSLTDIVPVWASRGWLRTYAGGKFQIRRPLNRGEPPSLVYALLWSGGPVPHPDDESDSTD